MASLTIRLHGADNVVVAAVDLLPGTTLPGTDVACRNSIRAGHKVAVRPIAVGAPIRKYNQVIGFATAPIEPGDHVHTHNVGMGDSFERDYAIGADARPTDYVPEAERATFQGILRPDGRVATRNYIGVLTSVNCSATAARLVADQFRGNALADFPNIDGVVALTHGYGCGMAAGGDAIETLRRTIAGYARHPNFAAVVILG